MAGSTTFLKTILIPLSLAALLYMLLALLLLPFIRRHRSRYTSYLPVPTLPRLAPSWRTKLSDALYHLFMPSTWAHTRRVVDGSAHDDELFDDDDDAEHMVGFEPVDGRRREALEQRRSVAEDERRLSRELEEGFKDESEDEGEERWREVGRRR